MDTNPNARITIAILHPGAKEYWWVVRCREKLFFKRKKEMGVDGEWGIFSMAIPGRVGYQCCNFYRRMIEAGEVVDPAYVLDENGKAKKVLSNDASGVRGLEALTLSLCAIRGR